VGSGSCTVRIDGPVSKHAVLLLPGKGVPSLTFARGGVAEEAAYAHDVEILQGYESDVRLQARIEALERRLVRIERGTTAGLLRRVVRRRAR